MENLHAHTQHGEDLVGPKEREAGKQAVAMSRGICAVFTDLRLFASSPSVRTERPIQYDYRRCWLRTLMLFSC